MDKSLGYSISVSSGEVTGAEAELESVKHNTHFGGSFDPNLRSVLMNREHSLPSLGKTESLGRTELSIAAC